MKRGRAGTSSSPAPGSSDAAEQQQPEGMQADLAEGTQQRQADVQPAHKGLPDWGLADGAQDERAHGDTAMEAEQGATPLLVP